jgi:malate dehydrogenase (oxaloacetate-decarboxylating)
VMEGKAILFKNFGWVDAIPIVLKTQDPDEIINIVENIAPTFGWINLEDISAPNCFYIEEELKKKLNIPVFHDDQHGTAIVSLAWLINALKLTNKKIDQIKVVVSWAWAAWIACSKLFVKYGVKNLVMFDSKWSLNSTRTDMNKYKLEIAKSNINDEKWTLSDSMKWADVFLWVSQPNVANAQNVRNMANKPIVFAMANPNPEISPDEAKAWWVYIMATWRSDYPNQINNVLAFPWLFRWVLDARISQITDEHKIAAAEAIANYVKDVSPENIIPSALDMGVANVVAEAVKLVG